MAQPRITFFCDLEPEALQRLFVDTAVIEDLLQLQASVRLALLDLSPERSAVVRRLNDAGIPVIAGLLLPKDHGLFLTMENASQVVARYSDFQAWTAEFGLHWASVGLDIELDIREYQLFASNTWLALLSRLRRAFDTVRLEQALAMYRTLVARMHADGYCVDSYQFPVIVDVRRAGSRLAQRVTGSGTESEARLPLQDWYAFARDLLYAHRWSENIAILSLEGCVNQGFMERLKTFDWDQPVTPPPTEIVRTVTLLRKSLRGALCCSAHPLLVMGGLAGLGCLLWLLSWLRSHKK